MSSVLFILSLRRKNARTTVTSGLILFTMEVSVRGRYLVTEKLMIFVLEPWHVLKMSGPSEFLSILSHTALLRSLLTKMVRSMRENAERIISIWNGVRSGLRWYRYLAHRKLHEYNSVYKMKRRAPFIGLSPLSINLRSTLEILDRALLLLEDPATEVRCLLMKEPSSSDLRVTVCEEDLFAPSNTVLTSLSCNAYNVWLRFIYWLCASISRRNVSP